MINDTSKDLFGPKKLQRNCASANGISTRRDVGPADGANDGLSRRSVLPGYQHTSVRCGRVQLPAVVVAPPTRQIAVFSVATLACTAAA
jgi:hypothetical protein